MTRVFFYHSAQDKVAAICQLLAKTAQQKKKILVYADQKSLLDTVDRVLWTQSALGFYPHCAASSPLAEETPVLLTDSQAQLQPCERLMNLAQAPVENLQWFSSVIEVVSREENDRLAARERIQHYKAAGCEVRYFDLSE